MSRLPIKQAVILAGGKGERLKPLTDKIPKPMIRISGKPFLEYVLNLAIKNGIEDFIICVRYLREQVMEYFGNGSKFGVNIQYGIGGKPEGIGHAMKNIEKLVDDKFIVINGDTYLPVNYSEIISFFQKKNKTGTLVICTNMADKVRNNVLIGNDDFILKYEKGSNDNALNGTDGGFGIFKKSIYNFFPDLKDFSFEQVIFPKLIEARELVGFKTDIKFYDIGSPEQLRIFERFANDNIKDAA